VISREGDRRSGFWAAGRVAHPDGERYPGVVDLDGLAGSMLTPQPRRLVRPLPGAAAAGDELGVAVALGGVVEVLPRQQLQRHPAAAELAGDRRPVRLGPARR
jgi:hypothetical protein